VKGTTQAEKKRKSSEATRLRLLEAGTREFGIHGFSAVSTRELAKVAEVNLAAIPYHFGGKEGLYRAIIEKIVSEAQSNYATTAKEIQSRLKTSPLPIEEGEQLIHKLISSVTHFLVGKGTDRYRASLIIRELMNPSQEFELLYHGFMKQMHTLTTQLVAALIHENPKSQESILRAHALLGQIVFFSTGRHLINTRTNQTHFTSQHLDTIITTVTETFFASIQGMRASRGLTQ
jgi:AcrR family transcriptional regulator